MKQKIEIFLQKNLVKSQNDVLWMFTEDVRTYAQCKLQKYLVFRIYIIKHGLCLSVTLFVCLSEHVQMPTTPSVFMRC